MKHYTLWLLPSLAHPERHARNGALPSASAFSRIARGYNLIACAQRKLLILRTRQYGGTIGPVSSGRIWAFYFRTGIGTDSLYCYVGVTQTGMAHPAGSPKLKLPIVRASDGVVINSAGEGDLEYEGTMSWAPGPDDVSHKRLVIRGLAPDTEYYCWPEISNGMVLHYLMVHEGLERHVDDSKAGIVNPARFVADGPIADDDLVDLDDAANRHWRCSGSQLLSWAPNADSATTAPTINGTTYVTIATLYVATQYHGTLTRPSAIPVKLAVRAGRVTGTGTGSFRLWDGTNAIEIPTMAIGSSSLWFTTTGTISDSPVNWQLQGKTLSGTSMLVHGVSLFEYSP